MVPGPVSYLLVKSVTECIVLPTFPNGMYPSYELQRASFQYYLYIMLFSNTGYRCYEFKGKRVRCVCENCSLEWVLKSQPKLCIFTRLLVKWHTVCDTPGTLSLCHWSHSKGGQRTQQPKPTKDLYRPPGISESCGLDGTSSFCASINVSKVLFIWLTESFCGSKSKDKWFIWKFGLYHMCFLLFFTFIPQAPNGKYLFITAKTYIQPSYVLCQNPCRALDEVSNRLEHIWGNSTSYSYSCVNVALSCCCYSVVGAALYSCILP